VPAIGIIDDRDQPRETLARAIEVNIPKELKGVGWMVNDSPPLSRLNDYPSWLRENDIAVLIVDERLTEQTKTGIGHVDYDGHKLVDFLRIRLPDFPIYIVTAFPNDTAVKDRFKDVEEIVDRKNFTRSAKKTVPRLIRAGQRYFDNFQEQLTELSTLSQKIALGEETDADVDRVKALQIFLQMPFITDPETARSKSLTELEEKLSEFDALKKQIEVHLKKGKAKAKKK
jgi:hypothetical protein